MIHVHLERITYKIIVNDLKDVYTACKLFILKSN